jgi:hypothetical protein
VQGCNIIDNSGYAFYASSCSDPGTVIAAENNWWGYADSTAIEAIVYHHADYYSSPTVDFIPFASSAFRCACPGFCDLDGNGTLNPVDVVYIVNYVYKFMDSRVSLPASCFSENGDWNCDREINPVDVVYYVNFVYKSQGAGPCDACK